MFDLTAFGLSTTFILAVAYLVKLSVDIARMAVVLPRWGSPALAVISGIVFSLLLPLATGGELSVQKCAQAVIIGVLAAGASVGATELQKREVTPLTLGGDR